MRWRPAVLLALFSALYFVPTCIRASKVQFWGDELLTLHASSLKSVDDLWSFLTHGLELNPPLGYLLVRAFEGILGCNEFGARLPSILAFWCMAICLYGFLRRRLPASFAAAGMIFPLLTSAARFSYEARPYALVLAFAGIALVAWQAAANGTHRRFSLPVLATALAAALCTHGLAVTLAIPFLCGELTRTVRRRRFDLPVWCAFAAATPPLFLLWKLKTASHTINYSQNLANPLQPVALTYLLILLPAVMPLAAALLPILFPSPRTSYSAAFRAVMPGHEVAALLGFVAIPLAAVPISTLGAPYLPRYSITCVIGLAGCLVLAAYRIAGHRPQLGLGLAGIFTIFFMFVQILPENKRLDAAFEASNTSHVVQPALERMAGAGVPIVISWPLTFLELEHYGSPALAARLYYLSDPAVAARRVANVFFDARGPALQEYFPLRAHFADYREFIAKQKRFVVVEGPAWWVMPQLVADGAKIRLVGSEGQFRYYEVSLDERKVSASPDSAPPPPSASPKGSSD